MAERLKDAGPEDASQLVAWTIAKMQKHTVPVEDITDTSFMKMEGKLYCAARPALVIGPVVNNPEMDGRALASALVRMIAEIRKDFDGDIIYLMRGEPDGVEELADKLGFVKEDASVMRLRGTNGMLRRRE